MMENGGLMENYLRFNVSHDTTFESPKIIITLFIRWRYVFYVFRLMWLHKL